MAVRILAATTIVGVLVITAVWYSAAPAAPSPASAPGSPSAAPATASSSESPAIRCEFEPVSRDELKAMQSGIGPADEAYARERCIAHEAFTYELDIDSTITGLTMLGRSVTKGRIPLIWFYGSRPKEGHWEGFGTLISTTHATGAPGVCLPVATVSGGGVYDFQVRWVQISLVDASALEVWIDAGQNVEAFDLLQIPACIGGGTSPTNFWENQFFLSHLIDKGQYGIQIRGWTGFTGPAHSSGLLAIAITPEGCQNMCAGSTTFTLHMTRRPVP